MSAPEAIQVSSLPLPPLQYINLFTDENVRRGRAPRPPPPIHDNYSMFGNVFNADDTIIRPLETQGIKRLYPQHFDRRRELKKLNHSLLVNFLDLIDLLVQCPDSPRRAEKVFRKILLTNVFFCPVLWAWYASQLACNFPSSILPYNVSKKFLLFFQFQPMVLNFLLFK